MYVHKAGGNGPAAPVLAGQVFLKVNSSPLLQKASIKERASVIFGLFKLILLRYNR